MSKTPEEIKRGLECCTDDVDGFARCWACPYEGGCDTDGYTLGCDALAYIRQLEAELMQPEEEEHAEDD